MTTRAKYLCRETRLCERFDAKGEAWKESIGYHRRSLAETAMYRMENSFGPKLKNRKLPNQMVEAAIRCKILNFFVTLGMPVFLVA